MPPSLYLFLGVMGGVYLAYLKIPVLLLFSLIIGLLMIKLNLRSILIILFVILAFFRAYPSFPSEINFKDTETSFTIRLTDVEKVKGESLYPGYSGSGGVRGIGRVISGPSFYKAPYLRFFIPEKAYVADREPVEGDVYCTSGNLRPLRPRLNPYGFSEKEFYQRRGISGVLSVEKLEVVTISQNKGCLYEWQFFKLLPNLRKYLFSIFQDFPSPAKEILPALTLGIKPDGEIKETFRATGTSHLLVVSGLHFALLFSFLFSILKGINYSKFLIFLILLIYLLLVGASPSSLRAIIMVGLPLLLFPGFLRKRSFYSFPLLFSAGALVLLILPYSIFDLGFYLSFGATAGIILISPHLKESRPLKILPGFLRDSLSITLGANLVILPLLLYNFLEFPTYIIPSNLLGTIIISFLLPLGFLYLLLHPLPVLSLILKSILTGLSFFLYEGFQFIARLPYSNIFIPFPLLVGILLSSFTFFVLYYFLRVKTLSGRNISRISSDGNTLMVGNIFILSILVLIITTKLLTPSGFELTFLYAGQGDGAMLRTPAGQVYILDAGSRKEDGTNYLRLLSRWGKTSIDGLIITHPHSDHYKGAEELIQKGYVKKIYSSSPSLSNPVFNKFLMDSLGKKTAILGKKIVIYKIEKNTLIKEGNLIIKLIPPSEINTDDLNTFSILIEVSFKDFDFLLPGDAPISHFQKYSKDIEVLRVPHHGARNSLSSELLGRIKPETAVISAGIKNPFGHPHLETVKLLEESGIDYFLTSKDGAITFRLKRNQLTIHPQIK